MHDYTVIGSRKSNINKINDVYIKFFASYGKNLMEIISLFSKYDRVLFHFLSIPTKVKLLFILNPLIMKKIVWIAWGHDLYQWKRVNPSYRNKIHNIIEYIFRKKIRSFVGIFPPDTNYFKKSFQSKAKTFYASYVGALYNPIYKKNLDLTTFDYKREKKGYINIQIGNRSKPVLNHMEVLEDLVRFKDENIKIYIPLTYGNKEYRDKVVEKASTLFGYKAFCILEMMDKEDYMHFLSTIDIAIFNTFRQIGLGNINPLLYLGKKLFMPAGSVMYNYYSSQGIKICDYSQIKEFDFKSFTKPVDMTRAKQYILSEVTNKKKKIQLWREVFDSI